MKKIALLLVFCILISSLIYIPSHIVLADSTTYYVSNSGSDSNSGTSPDSPWRTIGKVNSEFDSDIRSGDDVYFKRGDTFNDASLIIGISGASDLDRTVIGAYGSGDKPVIDRSSSYAVYMNNRDYITFESITVRNAGRLILVEGGTNYFTIQDCNFENSPGGWGSIYIDNSGGSYIRILNNYANNGLGDLIRLGASTYVLIEGNTLIGGPSNDHSCFLDRGSQYLIVRDNTMYDGGDDIAQIHFNPRNCLIENNILYGADSLEHGAGFKMNSGYRNIIRNNIIYNCAGYGMGGYTKDDSRIDISYCKWYHNTVYNSGDGNSDMDAGFRFMGYSSTTDEIHHNIIKNNIFHTSDNYGLYVSANPGYDAVVHDILFDNNIVYNSDNNDVKYMRVAYSMASAESNFPSIFQNNLVSNPELEDTSSIDFTLQSTSPAIDAGAWLTTTNGGGTGTAINVDDAGYFCDGFNLIDGDEISVGTDDVTITDVNYDTNVITVTPSITWSDNEPVSLRYSGSAPDIGAYESGYSGGSGGSDTISPIISDINLIESDPLDTDSSYGWIRIKATVTDNIGVSSVKLNIDCPDGSNYYVSMNPWGSNIYGYTMSAVFSNSGDYSYYIWATDDNGNTATSSVNDFSMPPNWDIDMNGECNVLDLTLISNRYNEQGANGWIREDIDNNGVVQVLDFVLASSHYYDTW